MTCAGCSNRADVVSSSSTLCMQPAGVIHTCRTSGQQHSAIKANRGLKTRHGYEVLLGRPRSTFGCSVLLPFVTPIAEFSVFDQCRYGLRAPNGQPMQKATRLFSNMPEVAAEFNNVRCNCQEAHAIAQGSMHGQRLSTWAQRYPRPMVQALAACSQAYCQRVFPA